MCVHIDRICCCLGVGCINVDTSPDDYNRALGDVIRGALRRERITVKAAAEKTGLSTATINRIISANPNATTVTQVVALARAVGESAEAIMIQTEELIRNRHMSEPSATNVTPIRRPDSVEELEQYMGAKAAHGRDPESDTDE